MSALLALLLLVLTGVLGRLLDMWQARVIASEADTNGVGITRAVEDRLFELELAVERLQRGQISPIQAVLRPGPKDARRAATALSSAGSHEVKDFQRTYEVLGERAQLEHSLLRQRRARLLMRVWRYLHISLACLAVVIIGYHSLFELWKMLVLHLIRLPEDDRKARGRPLGQRTTARVDPTIYGPGGLTMQINQ